MIRRRDRYVWSIHKLNGYDVGLDNIAFDVRAINAAAPTGGVPEPRTWAMIIFGFRSMR